MTVTTTKSIFLEGYAAPIEYFGWLIVDNGSLVRRLGRTLLVGGVRSAVKLAIVT